jgi:hypothetical protein
MQEEFIFLYNLRLNQAGERERRREREGEERKKAISMYPM